MLVPSWEDEKIHGTFQWRSTKIFWRFESQMDCSELNIGLKMEFSTEQISLDIPDWFARSPCWLNPECSD